MRDLGTVQNEIVKTALYPFVLVEFLLDSPDEVYLTSAHRAISYSGNTYVASGSLVSYGDVEETRTPKRPAMKFTVSGVDQTFVAIALTKKFGNRLVNLYKGFIGEDDLVVGGDLGIRLVYSGRVSSFDLQESSDGTSELNWNTTSIWGDFERSAGRRTNEADQAAYLSLTEQTGITDRAFQHSYKNFSDIKWGRV